MDCLGLPRLININRHEHRVSRTSVLGVANSICGVCHQKVDSTCGGYSCQKCPGYVVHTKCAIRKDVWNGKELEGVPEETEDTEPYVIIDDNTIQHFSHKEHYLRLNGNGVLHEENKRCNACTNLINLQSFYGCMDCGFFLHQNCAESPRKICHALHNERLTLVTSEAGLFQCDACRKLSNGFRYQHGDKKFDVRCCSIFEPFVHPSHPHHSLYYTPYNKSGICASCGNWSSPGLRCIEDGCSFFLGFECATLPQVVKHRVGEMDASGEYRCGICEKETDGNTLFYTNKDHQASFHKECLIGDFIGLMPGTIVKYDEKSYEVVLNNNSMSRPMCRDCELHCIAPIILKMLGTPDRYFCDLGCLHSFLYF